MQSNMQQNSNSLPVKKNIIETFMAGAKKGFYIGVELITPAMILGYTIIIFLQMTGLLVIVGKLLNPVMMIFGLPGQASVALIAAFFAKAAGAAAAATLYSSGTINAVQATILLPATILMGTLVGHYVRIVIVSNTNKKWHPLLLAVPIIDAVIAMLVTRAILYFMGM